MNDPIPHKLNLSPPVGSIPSSPSTLLARLEELAKKRQQMAQTLESTGRIAPNEVVGKNPFPFFPYLYPEGCTDADPGEDAENTGPIKVWKGDGHRSYEIAIVKERGRIDENKLAPSRGQFSGSIELNDKQQLLCRYATDFTKKEIVCIGSAGTGKTTAVRAVYELLARALPLYGNVHKHLNPNKPAIAICSYTRRAVRNLKRALQAIAAQENCITIHKLLEYAPEWYTEFDEEGNPLEKMRFSPSRHRENQLSGLLFVVHDESGMESIELNREVMDACPSDCRHLYLGDIYQLPPIYGSSILGYKLADAAVGKIPLVELTHVYRQALESPILRLALQVKDGKCFEFSEAMCQKGRSYKSKDEKSSVHVMPIAETTKDPEELNHKFGNIFAKSYKEGRFDPEQDVILIPHGKPHTFGSHQMNLHIAQAIAEKQGLPVHEVFAGYNKHYLCVGDKIAVGSMEGRVKEINRNAKYFGKFPRPASTAMDRWGRGSLEKILSKATIDLDAQTMDTLEKVDAFLSQDRIEDRKAQASHVVTIQLEDSDETISFSTAGELNSLTFTYALTVHRSQGAEWRNVYLLLHHVHAGMYSRELLYTAMTRARENLYLIVRPAALGKCVERAMIKGITLAEKAEFFKGKKAERELQLDLLSRELE